MSDITIFTNRKPRKLIPLGDLPEKARADFDYMNENDSYAYRFVQYKGVWYDVYDTMRLRKGNPFGDAWDSYHGDSFFSGVLFKLVGDDDEVICGRYIS